MNNRRNILVTLFLLGLSYLLILDFVEWITVDTDENTTQADFFSYVTSFARDIAEKPEAKAKIEEIHLSSIFEKLQAKNELMEEFRQACLPRFVCELFSYRDRNSLTESERSLMSFIMDTSLSTRPTAMSQYHFAAHIGHLLLDVEGNSCQNFYPACPLGANQALAFSRKLKMR